MYINARIHYPKDERDFRLDVAQTVMAPEGTNLESILRCMEAAFETQRQPDESVTLRVCLSAYTSIDKWNPGSDAPLGMIMRTVSVERKDAFAKVFQVLEGFRNDGEVMASTHNARIARIISIVVDDIVRNGRIRRALEKAQEQTKGRVCDR